MKKLLIIISICITFFSCSKDPSNPPGTNASGSFQYKVNGNLVVMDNVNLSSGQYVIFQKQLKGTLSETRYLLNAQKEVTNFLLLTIVADSLHLINYHYDTTSTNVFVDFILNFNGQTAGVISTGDYFDVNITGYQNSRISATFTAKLTPYSLAGFGQPGSTLIT